MRDVGTDHRAAVAEVQEVVRGGTFCSLQDINMLMKLSSYHHTGYHIRACALSLLLLIYYRPRDATVFESAHAQATAPPHSHRQVAARTCN